MLKDSRLNRTVAGRFVDSCSRTSRVEGARTLNRRAFAGSTRPSSSPATPVAPRRPAVSEQARPAPPIDPALSIERAERLGHSLERLGPPPTVPIQRVIYKNGKNKENQLPHKRIAQTNAFREMDPTGKAWFHHYHNDPKIHFTEEELKTRIKRHKEKGEPPPSPPKKKRVNRRKTSAVFVPRKTRAFVGTQVDYSKARQFRTERRIIRRLKKAGKSPGQKNIYTKRYKLPNGKNVKLITSSIPPGSLPKDHSQRNFDDLVDSRLGQGLHSEGVTDKIEKHHPFFKPIAEHEHYSASSREQCEKCRYSFPPLKPKSHEFGTFYSGTTDHIEGEELRDKLIKNKGVIGKLNLSEEEKKTVARGRSSAQKARQTSEDQNPLLNRQRNEISSEDSEGEHSSDDDDLYVTRELAWPKAKGWGKSKKPVTVLDPRSFFPQEEIKRVEKSTRELIKGKGKEQDEISDEE